MKCARARVTDTLDIKLSDAALARQTGDMVHFLVTQRKQPFYRKHCEGVLAQPLSLPEMVGVVQEYTNHVTQLCSRVNMALAADSPSLAEVGEYIRKLRSSVMALPLVEEVA